VNYFFTTRSVYLENIPEILFLTSLSFEIPPTTIFKIIHLSMKLAIIVLLASCALCLDGCTKYDKVGYMKNPGIALTFDDNYIDNWYNYLPLLDSFGVKATFYICRYHHLTSEQKTKLAAIQRKGHEIAFHTTHHIHMCQYLQYMTLDDLVQHEIYEDLDRMRNDGFYPTTFAYPYGEHNKTLDDRLLKIFKSVRALNGTKDYSESLTSTNNNTVLYGLGIDVKSKNEKTIERMIDVASQNGNCLVLVGHMIEQPNSKLQVPYNELKFILTKAKSLGMQFYTASQISN